MDELNKSSEEIKKDNLSLIDQKDSAIVNEVMEKDHEQGALLEKYQTDNRELRGELSDLNEKMLVEFNKYSQIKSRMEDLLKKENPTFDTNEDD